MNLLYITFGTNVSIHSQCAFSILSFLKFRNFISSINIITDAPEYYEHLKDEVKLVEIDEDKLREWRGAHDFFWRIKIKAIEETCNRYSGFPVVYLDTDTILYRDPSEIVKSLQTNKALMHEDEGALKNKKSKTEKRMWSQVAGRSFGGVTINDSDHMWNAGVVANPNTKQLKDIQTALQICDDMCAAGVTRRLVEQFAISAALSRHYGISAAEKSIVHYWSNKAGWDNKISRFFSEIYLKNKGIEDLVVAFDSVDLSEIPIDNKERNTARRLHKLVDKLFPVKEKVYLK